jgi:hypothetical protein
MKLYFDDDSAKKYLIARLRKAGHTVIQPADVSLSGASDPRHLLHAIQHDLLLMTRNHDDYRDLHLLVQAASGRHAGILVVRADNNRQRDMKDGDIVRALQNLERSGVPLPNDFHILNHWR